MALEIDAECHVQHLTSIDLALCLRIPLPCSVSSLSLSCRYEEEGEQQQRRRGSTISNDGRDNGIGQSITDRKSTTRRVAGDAQILLSAWKSVIDNHGRTPLPRGRSVESYVPEIFTRFCSYPAPPRQLAVVIDYYFNIHQRDTQHLGRSSTALRRHGLQETWSKLTLHFELHHLSY